MPTTASLERFIARVEQNAHAEAIEEFYTADASIQENQSPPRVGLANGDVVVIRWEFRFDWLDGTTTRMEELAYQRWQGELIAEETFFYDPAQRIPKKLNAGQSGK
jgi:hypothetical protein